MPQLIERLGETDIDDERSILLQKTSAEETARISLSLSGARENPIVLVEE